MYTWHNEGYFNEDLELSFDFQNFFRLRDLRELSNSQQEYAQKQIYNQMYPSYYQPEMHSYGASPEMHSQYNQMYSPYGQIPSYPMPSGVYQNSIAYPSYAQGHAYGHLGSNYQANFPQNYYSHLNSMAEDHTAQFDYEQNPYFQHH
jgi:hypothetical protein